MSIGFGHAISTRRSGGEPTEIQSGIEWMHTVLARGRTMQWDAWYSRRAVDSPGYKVSPPTHATVNYTPSEGGWVLRVSLTVLTSSEDSIMDGVGACWKSFRFFLHKPHSARVCVGGSMTDADIGTDGQRVSHRELHNSQVH